MFLRRLKELFRTTSFRLTLLFGASFVGVMCLLFGLIYWKSAGYLTRQVDASLQNDAGEFAEAKPADWKKQVSEEIGDPRQKRTVAIFTTEGKLLAGNLKQVPRDFPVDGRVHEFTDGDSAAPHAGDRVVIRALAKRMPTGELLVLAQNINELHKFHELILKAVKVAIALTVGLGIAGCVVMSIISLRRLDAMRRTSAKIMAGDLSQRFPTSDSDDDFHQLTRIVNSMLDEIERLMDEVKGVCDNIAHDLRTPLTRLRARLEGALWLSDRERDHQSAIEEAIRETDQLLNTFTALLRISEIEHGKRRAGFRNIDLRLVATEVGELYEPLAEEKGIKFQIKADSVLPIHGDRDLLFEAFSNLVDNAVKFTPSGGNVAVTLYQERGGTVFEVADTGPGIPQESREAVFRRFNRGDTTRLTPGTGLGLSLVAAVARLHLFELSIDDEGKGCRLRVNCWAGRNAW
jgi:signal transduction histidine kinase